MSLLRYDPTTKDWVIFAPGRASRPHDPAAASRSAGSGRCPFCPGHEQETPPTIAEWPGQGAWQVRVVANRFAALRPAAGDEPRVRGLFRCRDGYGAHEVVIESPDHARALAAKSDAHVAGLLGVLRDRVRALSADPLIQAVIVFKNHGEAAGTSLQHPHWQIIATPVVPRLLRLKQEVAAEYFDATGTSLYDELARAELAAGERVVEANDDFVAFVPYAAHVPFEMWIVPRAPSGAFGDVDPRLLDRLAPLLRRVLARLGGTLGDPAFNINLHTAPRDGADLRYLPWHLTISPRISVTAGFELGSGMAINTVLPEEAAAMLRAATPAS